MVKLKLENVILNIEYSPTYGAKSVLTGTITNYGFLPRLYTVKVYFIKNARYLKPIKRKGIVFRSKNFVFETNTDVDAAQVWLMGPLEYRLYDRVSVHPA